ncbi:MAG: DUF2752 domain-containing protein [Candidatus Zixiibacteriota bacterium]
MGNGHLNAPGAAEQFTDFRVVRISARTTHRLAALAALVVFFLLPSDGIGLILCPFKNITGLDCPACGLTRSVSSLLHLDFGRSLFYHPLGAPALLGLMLITVPVRYTGQGNASKSLSGFYRYRWQITVALFVTVWALRLLAGALTS